VSPESPRIAPPGGGKRGRSAAEDPGGQPGKDKWRGPFRGGRRLCSPAWAGGVDEAKGAVHWDEQRAGYQTNRRPGTHGPLCKDSRHPPLCMINHSCGEAGRCHRQPAAATQGKGDAPWVPRRCEPRALPHDVSAQRPDPAPSAPLRRVGLSGHPAPGSALNSSIGQSVNWAIGRIRRRDTSGGAHVRVRGSEQLAARQSAKVPLHSWKGGWIG
jgi:hypothetical protein